MHSCHRYRRAWITSLQRHKLRRVVHVIWTLKPRYDDPTQTQKLKLNYFVSANLLFPLFHGTVNLVQSRMYQVYTCKVVSCWRFSWRFLFSFEALPFFLSIPFTYLACGDLNPSEIRISERPVLQNQVHKRTSGDDTWRMKVYNISETTSRGRERKEDTKKKKQPTNERKGKSRKMKQNNKIWFFLQHFVEISVLPDMPSS